MEMDGNPYQPDDEMIAQKLGSQWSFRKAVLFASITAENVFAGRQPISRFDVINFREMKNETRKLLKNWTFTLIHLGLRDFHPSQRQLVEIIKALSQEVNIADPR